MALTTTIKNLNALLEELTVDLEKATGGNKAAAQRVRTNSIKFEKVAKLYRKESIVNEKKNKGKKKPATKKKVAAKPMPKYN